MEIVKAEILWSRQCKLKCSYCSMVTNDNSRKDWGMWKRGIQHLKRLGCGFCAIYGAEPLEDYDLLPEFISELNSNDIESTLITACYDSRLKEKLNELHSAGLRSLTVSYDGEHDVDKSSNFKTNRGFETLQWFQQEYDDLRDVAVVVTIHKQNYKQIPEIVEKMNALGIWTLFDFIHPDRGQNGSKCKNTPDMENLLFTNDDYAQLKEILVTLQVMKISGYKIHWSSKLFNYLIKNPAMIDFSWHCVTKNFPSWITVDNTGEIYCCDDFQIPNRTKKFYIDTIADRWEEFSEYWALNTIRHCPGCSWNTHWVADAIKGGKETFESYIHTED